MVPRNSARVEFIVVFKPVRRRIMEKRMKQETSPWGKNPLRTHHWLALGVQQVGLHHELFPLFPLLEAVTEHFDHAQLELPLPCVVRRPEHQVFEQLSSPHPTREKGGKEARKHGQVRK